MQLGLLLGLPLDEGTLVRGVSSASTEVASIEIFHRLVNQHQPGCLALDNHVSFRVNHDHPCRPDVASLETISSSLVPPVSPVFRKQTASERSPGERETSTPGTSRSSGGAKKNKAGESPDRRHTPPKERDRTRAAAKSPQEGETPENSGYIARCLELLLLCLAFYVCPGKMSNLA